MKFMKTLLLALPLLLLPIASSAGLLDGILDGIGDFDDTTAPSVPEPSGALVMGVALVTVFAVRRLRR